MSAVSREEYSEIIRNKITYQSRYKIPPGIIDEVMRQIDPELETIWEQGFEEGSRTR